MVRGNEKFLTKIYAFYDFLFILFGFLISWWLKFLSPLADGVGHLSFQTYLFWGSVYAFLAIGVGFLITLYSPKRKKSFANELFKVIQVHFLSLLFLLSILFTLKTFDISREFLMYFLTFNIILVGGYRYVVKSSLRRLRSKGYNKQYILILGAGTVGRQFHDNVLRHPDLGFDIIGFLDDFQEEHQNEYMQYKPIIGKVDNLGEILEKHLIDEVILALPLKAHEKYKNIVDICEKCGVRVQIIPDYHEILPARPCFDLLGDIPLINVRDVPLDELQNRMFKRLFDIIFAVAAIIITSPILIFLAVTIKITSPGPIIFKQERVGMNRRTFMMYKFRSMKHTSQTVSDTGWTTANDPRKTKFGSFIRKTSLDELPQFFNVLKGDMSVVGPRPERPHFVEQFKEDIPKYMIKHHVRPGITGWAQVNGLRGDTSISNRIKYDVFYIENWTFIFDLKIIIKTFMNGFVNKNAY